MTTDTMIILSQALKDLPYHIKIAAFHGLEGGYTVELHTKDGSAWGSGISQVSFVDAYTRAEKSLELMQDSIATLDIDQLIDEADYAATIADFEAGTGRR